MKQFSLILLVSALAVGCSSMDSKMESGMMHDDQMDSMKSDKMMDSMESDGMKKETMMNDSKMEMKSGSM